MSPCSAMSQYTYFSPGWFVSLVLTGAFTVIDAGTQLVHTRVYPFTPLFKLPIFFQDRWYGSWSCWCYSIGIGDVRCINGCMYGGSHRHRQPLSFSSLFSRLLFYLLPLPHHLFLLLISSSINSSLRSSLSSISLPLLIKDNLLMSNSRKNFSQLNSISQFPIHWFSVLFT